MISYRSIVGFLGLLAGGAPALAASWHFVALGDTAYNPERDLPVYERLIASINASEPAFTIHVGDTWGAYECSEEHHRWIRTWFDKYDHPVIYTPGDNEWTDCRKPELLDAYNRVVKGQGTPADMTLLGEARRVDNALAGTSYDDPLGSLATLRQVFYSSNRSLGSGTLTLVRQPDVSDFDDVVENARWEHEGVVFATVSVPGSATGFTITDEARATEAIERNRANVAWLETTFAYAAEHGADAVVIALHAGMFEDGEGNAEFGKRLRGGAEGPFYWVALVLRDLGAAYGKPVLLINGDFHEFVVDRPFFVSQGESEPPKYGNITRLQVNGAPELRAVRISVDTATPWVFGFEPLYAEP